MVWSEGVLMRRSVMMVAILASAAPAIAGDRYARAKAANDTWESCVIGQAVILKNQTSPYNAVEAAFGRCDQAEQAFRYELKRWSKGPLGAFGSSASPQRLDEMVEQERQRIRRRATAEMFATG
jgi:hypothetical protein